MASTRLPIHDSQLMPRTEPWPVRRVPFKAVPYHVWDHREAGEMVVWLREA